MNDQNDADDLSSEWAAALAEQEASTQASGAEQASPQPKEESYPRAQFEDLEPTPGTTPGGEDINLDVILDIPVTIAMEIGRTKISIRNLLQLNQGSVVELDRLAGEPLDVLVNGTLIAHG